MQNGGGAILSGLNAYVALAYGLIAAVCIMASIQPILAAIAFCALTLLEILVSGISATFKRLSWQIPAIAAFAFLNGLLVDRGSTLVFVFGPISLHLESMVYGASIATVILSTMNCFMLLGETVSSDEALMVMGRRLPVISLLLSMSIRMVPSFQRRSRQMDDVEVACTCARKARSANAHIASADRLTSLLARTLEDSLICADSMKARGWGSSVRRSTYRRIRLRAQDVIALCALVAFGIACLAMGITLSSEFSFYPNLALMNGGAISAFAGEALSPFVLALAYILYALFFLIPHIAILVEELKWRP